MNILITGTSGSGKSAIGNQMRKRGFNVIEADVDTYNGRSIAYFRNKATGEGVSPSWPLPDNWTDENDWVWRPDVMKQQLDEWGDQVNFVCGDSRNKQEAFRLFDKIFILSADDKTLQERIDARVGNDFGKNPKELAWIIEENKIAADEVSKAGGEVIDSTKPLEQVVEEILNSSGLTQH